jgi:hypothetical protein
VGTAASTKNVKILYETVRNSGGTQASPLRPCLSGRYRLVKKYFRSDRIHEQEDWFGSSLALVCRSLGSYGSDAKKGGE